MTQELWAILSAQARNAIVQVENHLGFDLLEADQQQVPLFPDFDVIDTIRISW